MGAFVHSIERAGRRGRGNAGRGGSRPPVGGIDEVSTLYGRLIERNAAGAYDAKPQNVWGWQIAGYLYLGGLGAGAFAVAVVLDWLGFRLSPIYWSPGAEWVWDWSKALVLWGPLAAGIGALLLILDLGRNWLMFMTAGRNPGTSWMARGFSILLSFIVTAGAVAAVAVFAPEWRVSTLVLWRVVEGIAVVAALGTAVYTGILLRSMTYILAWNTPAIPPLFLASALSTGSMGVLIGALISRSIGGDPVAAERLAGAAEVFEPFVIAAEALLLAFYVRRLQGGKPEAAESAHILLRGAWRYPFWIGVVGCALVFPLALTMVNMVLHSNTIAVAGGLCVLAGGLVLRLAVLGIGVKERPPLCRLGEWRGRHALELGA
ncbi:MAG: NrfD/PsrC family molybdoenzyme membrane anchor subunit [Thermoleophilia bacterium]